MGLYIGVPVGVAALLIALCGVAALSRGWLPSWQRRHIVRTRLFGWAQLLIATALGIQVLGGLLIEASGLRSGVTVSGAVVLLFGLALTVQAQRPQRGN